MKINEEILEGIAEVERSQQSCTNGNCSYCQQREEIQKSETLNQLMENIYINYAQQAQPNQWPDLMVQTIILDAFSFGFAVATSYHEINELEKIK